MVLSARKARWDRRGNVAWLTVDSPETRNALSVEVIRDVRLSLSEIGEVPEIGCVCIIGSGDVAWCAGMNLKDLGRLDPSRPPLDIGPMYDDMRSFPRPIMAVVNGYCVGGGISFLASCDLAIASAEKAVFGLPEIVRGSPPGRAIGEIIQTIPVKHVFDIVLSGRNWDAYKAQQVGLINRVVEHSSLEDVALKWASDIASFDAESLMASKKIIYRILDVLPHDQRIEHNTLGMKEMRAAGHLGMYGSEKASALAFLSKDRATKATWRETI